jgi:hypothetical protein
MTDQVLDQQPVVDNSQQPSTPSAETDGGEQSEVSIRQYRQSRERERPPVESRRPSAHADAPFEGDNKWQPSPAKAKGGFQRRIDALTREKSELQRQLAERQGSTSQGQQFESIEEYSARVIREAAERERNTSRQREAQPETARQQEVQPRQQSEPQHPDRYHSEMQRLRASNADFETVTADVRFPDYIQAQILRMEKGAEIAYALAKNKTVLKKILDLNAEAVRRGDGNFSEADREFGAFLGSLNTSTAPKTEAPGQGDRSQRHLAGAASLKQQLALTASTDPELATALRNTNAPRVPVIVYPAVLDTPNPLDVAVYLTKHPEMQQRIAILHQTSGNAVWQATRNAAAAQQAAALAVIQEVHRISAALEFGTALPSKQRVERPVSQAPTPITPVGGPAGLVDDDGDREGSDVDLARYRSYRNRQRNTRRG